MTDSADSRQKLWNMIKDIRFAMFTTRHGNGHLHSRPMTAQNSSLDEEGMLWFFMSQRGEPVADLRAEPIVNVVFADPGKDCYVSVSGSAVVLDDPAKKEALWSRLSAAWFPRGPSDPDLALVGMRITHANCWDVKESELVQLWTAAEAVVDGKPAVAPGDQGQVRMD